MIILRIPGSFIKFEPDDEPRYTSIPLETVCGTCHGDKMIQSAEWAAWYTRQAGRTDGEVEPYPDELEEYPCGDCSGVGTAPTPAGEAILNLVAKYQFPSYELSGLRSRIKKLEERAGL